MAESLLHKQLKDAADQFLRDNGCQCLISEADTVGFGKLPCRPDNIGVFTHAKHPDFGWRRWDVIEIESEPDLRGIEAEARKQTDRPANWTYILHPCEVEPDRETLRVPVEWGTLLYRPDGVIDPGDPAKLQHPYMGLVLPLFASRIIQLERGAGKSSQEARSSHGARLSPKDIQKVHDCLVTLHDDLAPDTPLRAICNHTGIDRKKLLKACKAGIPGFKYDAEQQTLMIEPVAVN